MGLLFKLKERGGNHETQPKNHIIKNLIAVTGLLTSIFMAIDSGLWAAGSH